MASLKEKAQAIAQVAEGVADLDPAAQTAAVAGAARGVVSPPEAETANRLWLIFVPGLLAIAAMLAVFVFILVRDGKTATDPAVLVSALTFVLGAVVGLFAPSPTSSGG
jgi:VIT1/CCC1 family predicted Fe2+/Mn2+ transporter